MPTGIYLRTEKHKGKHWKWSDVSRIRLSLSKKGCVSPNKGKIFSEEYKKKLSIAHLGQIPWNKGLKCPWVKNPVLKGAANPLWKGGITKDINKYQRDRYNNKKEYLNLWQRNYRKKNALRVKVWFHNRRKLLRGLKLDTVQRVYEDNIKKYGTLTCIYCLSPIKFGFDTLEHKIPLSKGGDHSYCNLGVACNKCNCRKNNKYTEQEFKEILCSETKLP